MRRRELLAMLHIGKKRLDLDDASYRSWMERCTGKRSGADCSDEELTMLVDCIRSTGVLDASSGAAERVMAGKGPDRPTARQWQTARGRVKRIGLDGGLDGAAFAGFVQRIAKVDSPRFLTRAGMQAVLIGLEKWATQRAMKNGKKEGRA